ncbi:MAG: sugar phosphate isomerase/epimerase family protein [Armatimonadota bacterium]
MSCKLMIGVMLHLRGDDPAESINKVKSLGLPSCQLGWPANTPLETGQALQAAAKAADVTVTTLWASLPGPSVWNFTEGPSTIGLVPEEYRADRVKALQNAAEVAGKIGIQSITTHVGFIPSWPGDRQYKETIAALKDVCDACKSAGVGFWYETGQETPITLLRTIQDVGYEGQGINLDPANLLMYGNGNPVDALDVFGEWVRGVHAKDGEYPTNGSDLGVEKAMGEGRVNFPLLVPKLKSMGYCGALTIEREISGDKQVEDIQRAMAILEPLC